MPDELPYTATQLEEIPLSGDPRARMNKNIRIIKALLYEIEGGEGGTGAGPNAIEQAAYLNSILTDADGNVLVDYDGSVMFTAL